MRVDIAERHLNESFLSLVKADDAGERREFMNALLRIVAMIIYESSDPEAAKEIAFAVIEAALNESPESLQ